MPHQADEYVETAELAEACRLYAAMAALFLEEGE